MHSEAFYGSWFSTVGMLQFFARARAGSADSLLKIAKRKKSSEVRSGDLAGHRSFPITWS